MTSEQHTLNEILSQPDSWRTTLEIVRSQADTLRAFFQANRYESLVFTGCGSTYYLSMATAALYRQLTHAEGYGFPASEVWLNADSIKQRSLLVAVSRSGETTETIRACETFIQRGGDVATLSCYPNSALTTLGAINLIVSPGQEESVAQTRAFSSLYLAEVALLGLWTGHEKLLDELAQLPSVCQRLLDVYQPLIEELGRNQSLDRFYFLGSGLLNGVACELSLKMKEMSLSHSEPFHFMEFRHGPKSMVTPSTLVVGLVSDTNYDYEYAVLREIEKNGAHILAIGEKNADICLESRVSEQARGALYLPAGQLLALAQANSKGLDPDHPHNLEAVVKLATSFS